MVDSNLSFLVMLFIAVLLLQPVINTCDCANSNTVAAHHKHFHSNLQELFMILEGEMEFVVNGEPKLVRAGETVDLPAHVVHTFRNAGSAPCKWVNIHSPKGFLAFFKDVGIDESEEDAVRKSVDEAVIQRVMQTAADFDMHIRIPSEATV